MALTSLENVTSLVFIEEKCIGCGKCTEVCPHGVFELDEDNTKLQSNVGEAASATRNEGVVSPTSSKGSKNNEAYVLNATWYKARIVEKNLCMECGACAMNCPTEAIEVNAGVGCAAAIINGWITGGEPSCDCGSECC
jgi:NAD-dependent dihydropyrimidine dehydrogenase PreA subunit